jgi:YVTN family beta-propeller protein
MMVLFASSTLGPRANAEAIINKIDCIADSLALNESTGIIYAMHSYVDTAHPHVWNTIYNNLSIVDVTTDQLVRTVQLEDDWACRGIAVNPLTNKVYLSMFDAGGFHGGSQIQVIDGNTLAQIDYVGFSDYPGAISINPATNKVYVVHGESRVKVINGSTDSTEADLTVGDNPFGISVNPITNRVYVTCSDALYIIDGENDSVLTSVGSLATGSVCVDPASNKIYMAAWESEHISVIDGVTNQVVSNITVGSGIGSMAVNPARHRLYVTRAGYYRLEVIDGSADTLVESLWMEGSPSSLCVNAATSRAYFVGRPLYQVPYIGVLYDPAPATTARVWGTGSAGVTEPATTWYLAEGSTGAGTETWVLVQNPNTTGTANVRLTCMTPSGTVEGPVGQISAGSRASFNLADIVPDAWSVATEVTSDIPVVAERSMYGPNRAWGTDSIGTSDASMTWYLAEGCTTGGFETWVLLQNPGTIAASAQLTYMTESGERTGPAVAIPPCSRISINLADTIPGDFNVSTKVTSDRPIVAERAVYWNGRKGATESIGAGTPEKTWYMAEGCTAQGFETWVLLMNPGDSTAHAELTYMNETGIVQGPVIDVPPRSRRPVNVADVLPNDFSVSTKVSSDQPIVAERAVYWNNRDEGQASIGSTGVSKTWYLAEGSTGPGFETWILVQNPGVEPATISLTYMTPDVSANGPRVTIPPNSRMTFNVGDTVSFTDSVSTMVTSDMPVIAERAVYGNQR